MSIINLDSERGEQLGFTRDKFGGYLWDSEGRVTISFIVSHQPGNLRRLFETILAEGKEVAVPTPLAQMEAILRRWGFRQTFEEDDAFGDVEIWVSSGPLPPKEEG